MLEELHIRGLGVIADATLELSAGLTVVTGETGAGKTMVVAGLALLFGGRGDAGRVRAGAPQALVEGRLRVPPGSAAGQHAADAGADYDEDGTLVAGRSLSAEGRSRAQLGGRSVPVNVLGTLGEELVTVHGQAGQLRLLRPAEQRAALDRFAGEPVGGLLSRHRELYHHWQAVERDLAARTSTARDRTREAGELQRALAAIEAVAPQAGEDGALRAEAQRLEHADALQAAAAGAYAALVADPSSDDIDATSLLSAAHRALAAVSGTDPALDELAGRVRELGYLAADVAGELAGYAGSAEADPGRLAQVNERRAALQGLLRIYADSLDGVLAWAAQAAAQLEELDGSEERLTALRTERDQLVAEVTRTALALSAARSAAAELFATAVTGELIHLALPQARIGVQIGRPLGAAGGHTVEVDGRRVAIGPDGLDDVELLFAGHAGVAARPLHKAASGGERSRVMLAVEVVFAAADQVPTLVFDEVDAGVGGRAAVEVGRRLARLAGTHQVIAVTHLAQVAAFADRHLVVVKDDNGSVTASGVHEVVGADRVRELARMLAGLEDSATGLAHAEELLRAAHGDEGVSVGRDRSRR